MSLLLLLSFSASGRPVKLVGYDKKRVIAERVESESEDFGELS
jgi:hypothetical protein